jgi:hypothetical protein
MLWKIIYISIAFYISTSSDKTCGFATFPSKGRLWVRSLRLLLEERLRLRRW